MLKKKSLQKALKTIHNIDIIYGIAYFRIQKKFFLKNEEMENRKIGNLGYIGSFVPIFLMSDFSILSYSRNRKLGFKERGKKIPRFPRLSRFPNFRPGLKNIKN